MKNALVALAALTVLAGTALPAQADEFAYHRTLDRAAPASGATTLDVTGYNGDVNWSRTAVTRFASMPSSALDRRMR